MEYYYAQINTEAVCFAVTQTFGPIEDPSMISIASYDVSFIGKRWTGSTWEDVPPPEPPAE